MAQNNGFGVDLDALDKDAPYSDLLEGIPELGYFSELANRNLGFDSAQGRFFQKQFKPILDEYFGAVGQQVKGGDAPTLRFRDFLEQFPFTRRFAGTSPDFAGRGTSRFNPRTRYLFY